MLKLSPAVRHINIVAILMFTLVSVPLLADGTPYSMLIYTVLAAGAAFMVLQEGISAAKPHLSVSTVLLLIAGMLATSGYSVGLGWLLREQDFLLSLLFFICQPVVALVACSLPQALTGDRCRRADGSRRG